MRQHILIIGRDGQPRPVPADLTYASDICDILEDGETVRFMFIDAHGNTLTSEQHAQLTDAERARDEYIERITLAWRRPFRSTDDQPPPPPTVIVGDSVERAHADYCNRISNAWRSW